MLTFAKGVFGATVADGDPPQRKQVSIGHFVVELSTSPSPFLSVRHKDGQRDLLSTLPGVPFIRAAMGDDDFTEGYGTFKIIDHDFYLTSSQTVDAFVLKTEEDGPCASLSGKIASPQLAVPLSYSIAFDTPSPNHLRFVVHIEDLEDRFKKVFLTWASSADERFFGFGEQLTHFDLKGKKVPIMVREDGVGRGVQPTTFVTNTVFGPYAGGDDVSAYKPVPYYLTSKLRCLFLESNDYSLFDITAADRVVIKVASPVVVGRLVFGSSPLDIIEEYTTYAGRMQPLPDWALKGIITGIQGGEEKVQGIVDKTKAAGVPLAAVWLQDWCGKREQKVLGRILKRLWWNWESDTTLYPNWPAFVASLQKQDVLVLTYVNSFLADVELGGKPVFRRNLYGEARTSNYLVLDESGTHPLAINSGPNFRAGLVDLFNPAAFAWLKDVMVRDVFAEPGVKGYMSDFAEFLPPGATLSDGRKATAADHNVYAELWSKLQREVAKEVGAGDKLIFHRSGFTRSPGLTSCFWTGDQLVSWDGNDGIKAGLVGLLSSGLTGFSMNHSDVGGYSGLMVNVMGMKLGNFRTKELLLRWIELGAFGVVFRTHEGSMPQANAQFYDDEETLAHLAKFGKLFASLSAYKKNLMAQAATKGFPLIRHLFLHFHEDPVVYDLKEQFLLGQHLLVAPVMDPQTDKVRVYLPKLPNNGAWYDVYTGEQAVETSYPTWVTVSAPLGRPAVFVDGDGLRDASLAAFFEYVKGL
ncbi:hypothetical protein HDU96_007080 [Phlyctochytrium bullatum]|nr:hypothetical protein HDU96_007080 [Phlyctochytrium bullatum]